MTQERNDQRQRMGCRGATLRSLRGSMRRPPAPSAPTHWSAVLAEPQERPTVVSLCVVGSPTCFDVDAPDLLARDTIRFFGDAEDTIARAQRLHSAAPPVDWPPSTATNVDGEAVNVTSTATDWPTWRMIRLDNDTDLAVPTSEVVVRVHAYLHGGISTGPQSNLACTRPRRRRRAASAERLRCSPSARRPTGLGGRSRPAG